jgi:hypothetical protein
MIITDAFWEKRNIGLKTCEITISATDSMDDYIKSNVENEFEYIIARIPAGRTNLIHAFEGTGFKYLENQFQITVDPQEIYRIDSKWQRILNGMNCRKIKEINELQQLLIKITPGMFNTDRVFLDPELGKKASISRYRNWLKDLNTSNSVEIYLLFKHEKEIGFFVLENNPGNIIHCILAGLFDEFKGHGNAVAIIYLYLKMAFERGASSLKTSISSNNRQVINLFTNLISFKVQKIYVVLRKMNNLLGARK